MQLVAWHSLWLLGQWLEAQLAGPPCTAGAGCPLALSPTAVSRGQALAPSMRHATRGSN